MESDKNRHRRSPAEPSKTCRWVQRRKGCQRYHACVSGLLRPSPTAKVTHTMGNVVFFCFKYCLITQLAPVWLRLHKDCWITAKIHAWLRLSAALAWIFAVIQQCCGESLVWGARSLLDVCASERPVLSLYSICAYTLNLYVVFLLSPKDASAFLWNNVLRCECCPAVCTVVLIGRYECIFHLMRGVDLIGVLTWQSGVLPTFGDRLKTFKGLMIIKKSILWSYKMVWFSLGGT